MAWTKKTWIDRLVEFPGRRKLTNTETGRSEIVDVERSEGVESQRGDPFSAETMNDMETRIDEGFAELKKSVSDGKTQVAAAITAKKVVAAATDSFAVLAQKIGKIVMGSGNAQRGDVLSGKTFTNNDGVQYTGSMANNGAVAVALQPGQAYRIPAGYHNGQGTVGAGGEILIFCGEIGGQSSESGTDHTLDVKSKLANWASLTINNFLFDVGTNFRSTGGDVDSHYCYITKSYADGIVTVNLDDTGNRRDTIYMNVYAHYSY